MAVVPMLTPNNAVLTTATIEIATLRLDKRQVTAAVFRQVTERSPIAADDGLIEGAVPWGTVNYWWSEAEKPGANAIHLLWQLGNRLHRARLWCPLVDPRRQNKAGKRITGELFMPEDYAAGDVENCGGVSGRASMRRARSLQRMSTSTVTFAAAGSNTVAPNTAFLRIQTIPLLRSMSAHSSSWGSTTPI
jgi:hypothetical protein